MKTRILISVIIFTFVFVVTSLAQEQATREYIEKAMQEINQVSPERVQQKIPEGAIDVAAQKEAEQGQVPKEMNIVEIEGIVKEVAEDGSYIMVNDTTVITTSEFLAYNPVKEGDQVVVMAASTDEGIKAINISMAAQNKEENTEELSQPIGEEAESEDYISDDTQKEVVPEEESSQETPSENLPQDVIE